MFVSSQPIMAGLGGLFVFPVGLRLWSLVHLLFFISQSDCSRSYLFHFGVLSRALPLPFYSRLFTQLSGWSRVLVEEWEKCMKQQLQFSWVSFVCFWCTPPEPFVHCAPNCHSDPYMYFPAMVQPLKPLDAVWEHSGGVSCPVFQEQCEKLICK